MENMLTSRTKIYDETTTSHQNDMRQWHILAILSILMGFASISTDFYLPAMPEMAKSLSANAGQVALTVSGYLAGFSLGQLFWGPVRDRYGRRLPIAIGIVMFTCGSARCALSATITTMIIWRVVQAVGHAPVWSLPGQWCRTSTMVHAPHRCSPL
jgi:DHA1 family bicyclomycin/chloramphenicol resistance-like MFS transporter